MLIIDASAIAEILLGTSRGLRATERVGDEYLVAPEHCVAEVLSIMRGLYLGGSITETRAQTALKELREIGIDFLPTMPLLEAAWQLRHNVSAYDALYVALAESLNAKIISFDSRLAKASPHVVVP
ncbi:MAG: type II toxin-antitoxin system VapC family toxin [Microbacteriaceae bacterium]|nr:type II toxin-antitoxin system VapC family toxin [Microbacteriaceae bacterium]